MADTIYSIRPEDLQNSVFRFNTIFAQIAARFSALEKKAAPPVFADDETPIGLMDGVNLTFKLRSAPNPQESLQLFLGTAANAGELQRRGVPDTPAADKEYTLVADKIIMVTAPAATDWMRCWYRS